ncbi:ABC transporter ATP-binding protein [Xylanibacillus composti]|uniref:ABC transporter n=1 Tax=Xylanibacillus composti TaxID=1572762 RepID=A0A8J4M3V7_9BACL|nr:ABC transporter ATP-binding protein [Xylanibacillus composti]MDT9725289.1 ABC transporter ATP-binding protein [Xylanibacillus composti]GIQ70492.1 ABC transporter [Xylanibacillus composti]
MLEVKNLTKVYPGGRGIQGLNLTVNAGEVVALLGPNGAGKTTAMQAMAGWIRTERGESLWNGVSVADRPDLTKQHMGLMIGEPTPYAYLTGYDYLKLYAKLYPGIDEARMQQTLDLVGMAPHQKLKIKKYSTGMKQRIELASVLLHQPKLLILDEPFSGMDIEGRWELTTMLRSLVSETGMSIIVSSHQVHDIEDWITHVCILHDGQQIETAGAEQIRQLFSSVEEYYLHCVAKGRRGAA